MINEEISNELEKLLKELDVVQLVYQNEHQEAFISLGYAIYENPNKESNSKLLYNSFYTKACRIVKEIIPERLAEFELCYRNKDIKYNHKNISKGLDAGSFTDDSYLINYTYNVMEQQKAIIQSIFPLLDSKLFSIEGEIQYNFFTEELKVAEHLLKNKYIRPAGVVAGVALESHLKRICQNHEIKVLARDDINNYKDKLKKESIIDTIMMRKMETMADIRNLCAHKKERDATKEEVQDLIIGTKKIITEVN